MTQERLTACAFAYLGGNVTFIPDVDAFVDAFVLSAYGHYYRLALRA